MVLKCAECGSVVIRSGDGFKRGCGHERAAVVAEVSAKMKGVGGLR